MTNTQVVENASDVQEVLPKIPKEDVMPMPERTDDNEKEGGSEKRGHEDRFELTDYQRGMIDKIIGTIINPAQDKSSKDTIVAECCRQLGIDDESIRTKCEVLIATVGMSFFTNRTKLTMDLDIVEKVESALQLPDFRDVMEKIRDSTNPEKDSAKHMAFKFPDRVRHAIYAATSTFVTTSTFEIDPLNLPLSMALKSMAEAPLVSTGYSPYAISRLSALMLDATLHQGTDKWSHENVEAVISRLEKTIGDSRYSVLRWELF